MNLGNILVLISMGGTSSEHLSKWEWLDFGRVGCAEMGRPKQKADVAFVEPSSNKAFPGWHSQKNRGGTNVKYHSNGFGEITERTLDRER